jgi:hypothetical protein
MDTKQLRKRHKHHRKKMDITKLPAELGPMINSRIVALKYITSVCEQENQQLLETALGRKLEPDEVYDLEHNIVERKPKTETPVEEVITPQE